MKEEIERNTGNPVGEETLQPESREGQTGPIGVTDRSVVPEKCLPRLIPEGEGVVVEGYAPLGGLCY